MASKIDFQTRVKKHLGNYKRDVLGIKEDGIYTHKNTEYHLEHILPQGKENENILSKYREGFLKDYGDIKKHMYFHHLNSSQAMCVNFFYPLIKEQSLNAVLNVLGIQGDIEDWKNDVHFEKVSDLEKAASMKTNFDFYIKVKTKEESREIELFFEIKYGENEFGKAKKDTKDKKKYSEEYKKKYEKTYKNILISNPSIEAKFKNEESFLNNYQIMRNLIHISSNKYVIFIYPYANITIRNSAEAAKQNIIKNQWKDHFILLTWEYLIEQVISDLNSSKLIDYYKKDFTDKYMKY